MANPRPFVTLYSLSSKRQAKNQFDAIRVGRSASPMGAIRSAVTMLNRHFLPRADIYNEFNTHLYRILKVGGGIHIERVCGERL